MNFSISKQIINLINNKCINNYMNFLGIDLEKWTYSTNHIQKVIEIKNPECYL